MEDRERRTRLEALFNEHVGAVRAYALRRTDPVSAEDAVMDVFLVACRRLEDVPEKPLPWLLACARRVLANQRRTIRRCDALVGSLAVASDTEPPPAAVADRLNDALESLRGGDREILLLSAWEGLQPLQIAQVLGCSRSAAAVRLHRARKRFTAAFAPAAPVIEGPRNAEALR